MLGLLTRTLRGSQPNSAWRVFSSSRSFAASAVSATSTPDSASEEGSMPSTSGREDMPDSGMYAQKPDLVDRIVGIQNKSRSGAFQSLKMDLAKDFQRHPQDVGSPEVVVALWTHWIRSRTEHYQSRPRHAKAVHTLRHLELVVNKRRRLLAWLRRSNPSAYTLCLQRLGLADVFGEGHLGDRYPMGFAHGDPAGADDAVRRQRFAFHTKYRVKKSHKWKKMFPMLVREDPHLREFENIAPKMS